VSSSPLDPWNSAFPWRSASQPWRAQAPGVSSFPRTDSSRFLPWRLRLSPSLCSPWSSTRACPLVVAPLLCRAHLQRRSFLPQRFSPLHGCAPSARLSSPQLSSKFLRARRPTPASRPSSALPVRRQKLPAERSFSSPRAQPSKLPAIVVFGPAVGTTSFAVAS
jgi:hypothetical protein